MTEGDPAEDATLFPRTVGERLRAAREEQKLDLADVAQRTRVPLRHLQAIESGDYSGLPSATYAIGFAKAYARAVNADEAEIGRQVRNQLEETSWRAPEYQPYETDDPSQLPSRGLTIAAVAVALLVLIGVGLWYGTGLFRGDAIVPAPVETVAVPPATDLMPAAAPAESGQVSLVATDTVWVKIYDATGKTLYEKEMAAGERYDVPANADHPMINVGRPDKLTVLLNGSSVMPLGSGAVALKDVEISATALIARSNPQPTPNASASATPAAGASPAPAPSASRSPSARPSASATRRPAPAATPVVTPPVQRAPAPVFPTPSPSASATTTSTP